MAALMDIVKRIHLSASDRLTILAEAANEIERLRAALEKIANRFDWAEHPGTLEWQTREEALAALK
jgi:hypothetical protein